MDIIRGDKIPGRKAAYPVVAIGNFDGVHRGHQAILKETVKWAKAKRGTSIVLTFEPHPLKVLAPSLDLKFLMTFEERMRWIAATGIRKVRCVPFTPSFADLTPVAFAQEVLRDSIGARDVLVGANFAFGKDRKGSVRDLEALGPTLGFLAHAIDPVAIGGRPVSSSRIRECLMAGHVTEARELLGRPYYLEGKIIPGARRGWGLGFPTANFKPPRGLVIPCNGVYAIRAELDGRVLDGVNYIGTQPTLGSTEWMVETHFFEPQDDLYDRSIRVEFIEWVRPERVFKDRAELVHQIKQDIRQAKEILTGK